MAFSDFAIEGVWRGRTLRFRSDRLIVAVLSSIPFIAVQDTILAAIASIPGLSLHSVFPKHRWGIIAVAQGGDVAALAMIIDAMTGIRFAEPDFVLYGHTWPDDTEYASGNQDWITKINLEEAWTMTTGSTDVLLAVLDSGIEIEDSEFSHPDLQDPAHLSLDDPDGRYIARHDDASGAAVKHDYVDNDDTPEDNHGHGTWITGILAAMSNNGQGVAGVNWSSRVYIARVLDNSINPGVDEDPPGTYVSVVLTAMEHLLDFAASRNIERVVVNMSFGSKDSISLEEEMADMAEGVMQSLELMCSHAEKFTLASSTAEVPKTGQCILCCAPGFYETGSRAYADYPSRFAASYDHVISVGSTDGAGTITAPASEFTVPADPDEVTIMAPGHMECVTTLRDAKYDDPGEKGTSLAAPMVAGVVSLMWSTNPSLTPAQIKECLWNSGDSITSWEREYRQVNAGRALKSATPVITLDTPTLSFVDISDGTEDTRIVTVTITSCASLSFAVKSSAMDAPFSIVENRMTFDPADSMATGISVKYTAGAAGTTAFGSIVVECEQSGETWTVYLTANTAGAPAVALVLVADKSGSMSSASGIDDDSRMDVLHEALKIAIETLQTGDSCAVVSFDTDAATVQATVQITGNDATMAERNPLYAAVSELAPGGATSIGDGVLQGLTALAPSDDQSPALLVVTDGFENEPEFIVDVMDDVGDVPVFAIGMGTAEAIRPEALQDLTSATRGYLVLTGSLHEEIRYQVAKYCVQMLSEAVGGGLIVDPEGMIRPDQTVDVPFWVSSEDYSCDVIVMMPSRNAVLVELRAPDGRRVEPGSAGVELYAGRRTSRHRLRVPRARSEQRDLGKWVARLSVDSAAYGALQKKRKGRARRRIGVHGIPYCALVTCRSGVLMKARAYAASHEPGNQVLLRALTTLHGLPVRFPPAVTVRISLPDGTNTNATMTRVAPGVNEYEFVARIPGVYTCRVRATGLTARGDRYQREQTITAQVWNEPRGATAIAPRSKKKKRVR